MEGDFGVKSACLRKSDFNPHHILDMEGGNMVVLYLNELLHFNPHTPNGERLPSTKRDFHQLPADFNPRPHHGGRALALNQRAYANPISIHVTSTTWRTTARRSSQPFEDMHYVLCMEDDNLRIKGRAHNFSLRPPHGGRQTAVRR